MLITESDGLAAKPLRVVDAHETAPNLSLQDRTSYSAQHGLQRPRPLQTVGRHAQSLKAYFHRAQVRPANTL